MFSIFTILKCLSQYLYLLLRCFENICTTLFVRDKVVSWVIWCLLTPARSPYHCLCIHPPPQLSIHVTSFSCSTRNSVIANYANALSKSDKSYYICKIGLKRLLVKYETYGTLSIYLHLSSCLRLYLNFYLEKQLQDWTWRSC